LTEQLSLFESEAGRKANGFKFRVGDVVRMNWPWLGHFQVAYPYHHVRAAEIHTTIGGHEIRHYLCHAVPYGACPAELTWIPEHYLISLGFSWLPPSYEVLTDHHDLVRSLRYGMGDPWDEGWPAEYMNTVSFQPNSFRGAKWPCHSPYDFERELVEFLDTQPVKWYEVARETWYDFFPNDRRSDLHRLQRKWGARIIQLNAGKRNTGMSLTLRVNEVTHTS